MRALRFHAARDVRVDEVEEPPPPAAGEVLVAPVLCGICGTDLHEYVAGPLVTTVEPHPVTGGRLPQILGHELSATVVATGPGVTAVVPGDRVSVMPLVTCGRCAACRRGHAQHCKLRAAVGLRHPWGGMAELALVAERQVARLPDAVSWEQGALVEPTAVAAGAVSAGQVGARDAVLIVGAGPIGALAALVAEAAGAADVLVSEPDPERAASVRSLGFDVIDPGAADVVETCRERHEGGVDVAIECAGRPAALEVAVRAVRSGGRVVQAGLIDGPVTLDAMGFVLRGLSLIGSVGYPLDSWPGLLERIATGRLPVERVVTGRVALDAAVADGFERLANGGGGALKVLVDVRAA